jgi:succinate-semialdehyde dehydrogenase
MAVDDRHRCLRDKILKNKGKARVIWNNLKDKKSRGIIGETRTRTWSSSPSR